MELRYLRSFVAVAEELHFGRAAASLNMAQSPLSQQIRKLERELDVELFERTTRSVSLTSAGASFLGPARKLLQDAKAAEEKARAAGRGKAGSISIGFTGGANPSLIPKLAYTIRKRFPQLVLNLQSRFFTQESMQKVLEGKLDLALVTLRGAPAEVRVPRGLSIHPLSVESTGCLMSMDHRLSARRSIRLGELRDEAFVMFSYSVGSAMRKLLEEESLNAGFLPRIEQESEDAWTVLALVAAGVGMTITTSEYPEVSLPLIWKPLSDVTTPLLQALVWNTDSPTPQTLAVLEAFKYPHSLFPTKSRNEI